MKIRRFDQLNENIEDTLGVNYDKVWVVMKYGDTSIYKIFLNKEDAEKVREFKQEEYDRHFQENKNKYKVLNLDDAIDYVKDAINDMRDWEDSYNG